MQKKLNYSKKTCSEGVIIYESNQTLQSIVEARRYESDVKTVLPKCCHHKMADCMVGIGRVEVSKKYEPICLRCL